MAFPFVQLGMLLALRGTDVRTRLPMASNFAPVRPAATPRRPASVAAPLPLEFPSWPLSVLAVPILVRAGIFVVAILTEPWSVGPNRVIPVWAQLLQAAAFGGLALVLLRFGRHDRRAWALGLFILDAGTTLLTPFVRASTAPTVLTWLGLHLRTDAFQAAMAWFFAGLFPRSSTRPRLAAVFFVATTSAFALGVLLVVADTLALALAPAAPGLVTALQRQSPGQDDWYFTLQFLLMAPLLVLMPLKLRECGPDARRRFYWLALGLAVGFLPLVANTMLQTYWARFGAVPLPFQRLRGALIVTALTAVPVAAAYAALVQRTLDVRLVLRRALQYVLARAVIRGVAIAPFVALAALVVLNRNRPLSELASGPTGLVLSALTLAGAIGIFSRRRLLVALDRRFFRQEIDARQMLVNVAEGVRHAESIEEVRDTLATAIERALHPESLVTAITGSDDCLHAIDADVAPLRRVSALAQLVEGGDAPLDVAGAEPSIVARLGESDRAWLTATGAATLVPLRGSRGELCGVVALGPKASELPYSSQDRELLAAVGASGGFAIDRILTMARHTAHHGAQSVLDPPARECTDCGTVVGPEPIRCGCGGALRVGATPVMLADRLRFERRIGAGGMGVVYRATDLRLHQARAVKTLPGADPVMMARLRREARAMASATHPNLATLHSLESWRGSPMLVMEFLEGGSLSDRLHAGPLSVGKTLTLGIALGRGLAALHGRGLLHRDIKPSNIGFSADDTPKLLDFGLARLMAVPGATVTSTDACGESPSSLAALTEGPGIPGTPAYISPEVLDGAPPTPADDVWSLAVTLLEACTGANPYRAATVASTVARVLSESHRGAAAASTLPAEVGRVFAQLLGPRAFRPASAEDLVHALTHCATNGG